MKRVGSESAAMAHPGPSSSSTESSRVSDSYGTCDDLDYDDDQSSSLELESDLKIFYSHNLAGLL